MSMRGFILKFGQRIEGWKRKFQQGKASPIVMFKDTALSQPVKLSMVGLAKDVG